MLEKIILLNDNDKTEKFSAMFDVITSAQIFLVGFGSS